MKITLWSLCAVFVLSLTLMCTRDYLGAFHYEQQIGNYWDLSVKASTIKQKSQYLDQFVDALGRANLADNDAIFLRTGNNSVAQNMIALKSLQSRMHAIIGMDENSFQYQQAMQQVTGQEQDGATSMLDVFSGAWYLRNHPFLWGWIGGTLLIFQIIGVAVFAMWALVLTLGY